MKRFIDWLVKSSANPEVLSLTVRGSLIGIIPTLLFFGQILELSWTEEDFILMVQAISSAVSGFLIFVGLVRKVVITSRPILSEIARFLRKLKG